MKDYIAAITKAARSALIAELDTTPKPGLVDKKDSGAHSDMDYALFMHSIDAITPYLEQFALLSYSQPDLTSLALILKDSGKKAEEAMLMATGGINTHRGAIFCLALSIGAICARNVYGKTCIGSFNRAVSSMASVLAPIRAADTHGSCVMSQYGIKGAMGQALDGYRDVLGLALPLLQSYNEQGLDSNEANIRVLLRLMTSVDDTCVLYRKGKEGYDQARAKAASLLDNYTQAALQYLCMDFNTNNISFGGAADMLMLSLFAKELFDKGFLTKDC